MLDCLTGYIGLRSAVGGAGSDLYLDTLPNINILNTQKITEIDKDSADDIFKVVEKRAISKFVPLFMGELQNCRRVFDINVAKCLICENKELLSIALLYLMGVEMLNERLGSDRINRHTTTDRQKATEIREDYLNDFEIQLKAAVNSIDLDGSDCLGGGKIECVQPIVFREFTP